MKLFRFDDPQKLFDFAKSSILQQGTPATANGICILEDADGNKCILGFILSDDAYAVAKTLEVDGIRFDLTDLNEDDFDIVDGGLWIAAHRMQLYYDELVIDSIADGVDASQFITRFNLRINDFESTYISPAEVDMAIAEAETNNIDYSPVISN